jgi:hypothetical protein
MNNFGKNAQPVDNRWVVPALSTVLLGRGSPPLDLSMVARFKLRF